MTINNGTYAPNTPGAKTLRDAKPLWINGHHITAEIYEMDGVQYVSVFFGTEISFGGKLPAEITNVADLYEFIIASANTYANVKHAAPKTFVATSETTSHITVTVYVPANESTRYVGQKAAGAARKIAKGKVWRTSTTANRHDLGTTYTYTYARG